MGFLKVLQTIIALIAVIGLANISLKLLNKYMVKENKIIRILEKTSISNSSSLAVVEISGSYYLMSFTQNENKILKELDLEEIEDMLREKEKDMDIRENSIYKRVNSFIEKRKMDEEL